MKKKWNRFQIDGIKQILADTIFLTCWLDDVVKVANDTKDCGNDSHRPMAALRLSKPTFTKPIQRRYSFAVCSKAAHKQRERERESESERNSTSGREK